MGDRPVNPPLPLAKRWHLKIKAKENKHGAPTLDLSRSFGAAETAGELT